MTLSFSNWNADPFCGKVAPLTFGKELDYRDPDLVGDIKYLWEPNRHLHLVTLAQAYRLTDDPKYLHGLKIQLESWLDQCPYLMGPNWTSSLELAIRLINWSLTWQLVGGLESPLFREAADRGFRARWLESIYRHAHFIRGHLSRYSSANNHLIGEAGGLFVAGVTWPYWGQIKKWAVSAKAILEEEALKQNGQDGVNREQAVSYQQFVLDFLIIAGLTGRANGMEFSTEFWRRIEAMLEYLCDAFELGEDEDLFSGWHDGYKRVRGPVVHRREIRYLKGEGEIRVTDILECKGEHAVERFWHFAEDCRVTLHNGTVLAENGGIRVQLESPGTEGEVRVYRGDDRIPLGWVSRRFDLKVPTATALWRTTIGGPCRLTTIITVKQ